MNGYLNLISEMVGGRDRDRTGDPLLAKHQTRLHPRYSSLPTTNVSNKSGNLLLAQRYPQWHEDVRFVHSRHAEHASSWSSVLVRPRQGDEALLSPLLI